VAKNDYQKVKAFGSCEIMAGYIGFSVNDFIDANGEGPECGYKSGTTRRARRPERLARDPLRLRLAQNSNYPI
jgi:hypothetical protein